ncbi:DUF397 domain-containing protein [Streptomyces sp. NPDC054940]
MTSTALQWFKSSYSSDSGECLEVALTPHTIHIRDSKNVPADGPTLRIGPDAWSVFTAAR